MLKSIITTVAFICAATFAQSAELLMVEEDGCFWCAKWNKEIGPSYPNTDEGEFAPLKRVDIHDLPLDVKLARTVVFTPTFVLVENGKELSRIEGYPGEDFFWPLMNQMLKDHTQFIGDDT